LIDAKTLAVRLGVKPRLIFSFADQGLLPYHRVGKRLLRFSESDIETFLRRSAEARS